MIQAVCWDISNVSGLLYELLIIKEKSMHTAEELNGIYYFKGLKKLSAYELLFWVNNLGTFVGRTVPVLGWVILAVDVSMIGYHTVNRFNTIVRPEDKIW